MITDKALERDFKIKSISDPKNIEIDTSSIPGFFYFLPRNRKTIKDFFKRGFILTGSRALRCYSFNGKPLLDRKPNDWDFILTTDQFLEVCRDYKIYDFKDDQDIYVYSKSFMVSRSGYGDSHYFPMTTQLIIKNELPEYTEKNGIKFSSLDEIISSKMRLSKSAVEKEKHSKDLKNIFLNFI